MRGWQAIVVAGGRASRMGGLDKAALGAHGTTLLDRALLAAAPARAVALVGRGDSGERPGVLHVDESPRFGGPVAALAAGLAVLGGAPWTLVLAADLPGVRSAVPLVLAARPGPATDGVLACDESGRRQPLLAVYRTASLVRALAALPAHDGASMRALLAPLVLATVPLPDALCADVDTPEDARRHGLALSTGEEAARVA